ncbi:MAG: AAA family ATPase [bacterium]|nr:AAA family ATPase [bacterium]MBU1918918.1 AAA family ATPase [bacterium]
MKRLLLEKLKNWQKQPSRKPLILEGARQVGKTYLLEQFGRTQFQRYHLLDFTEDSELHKQFEIDLKPERIIRDLSVYLDTDIDIEKDLIIFDEIQACSQAVTALKYFYKKYPNMYLCASGSFLGLGLNEGSFPVGKVERHTLFPMTFYEFLLACDEKRLVELIDAVTLKDPITGVLHNKLWSYLKLYFITGGLPEVVQCFLDNNEKINHAFSLVRELHKTLVKSYMDDFAKHSGKIKAVKIEAVFKSIPKQIAKENNEIKKFVFKGVLPVGSKYANLEAPIQWLIKAGLIHKVPICHVAHQPLEAYTTENKFKLYLFDIGILGSIVNLSPKTIYEQSYGSHKGYFAENYLLQELITQFNRTIFSWHRNTAEIEFLLEHEGIVIPIEVKAGINTKAKSLKVYQEKYKPEKAIIFSGQEMNILKDKQYLPLYLSSKIPMGD